MLVKKQKLNPHEKTAINYKVSINVLIKDEDKESDDRKSKTLSHKGDNYSSTGDYGDEDDDDCCCCCIMYVCVC